MKTLTLEQNPDFQKFVAEVTPPGKIQEVWVGEVIMLLFEIFKALKDAGCFEKRAALARTKRAMALQSPDEALRAVLKKLTERTSF